MRAKRIWMSGGVVVCGLLALSAGAEEKKGAKPQKASAAEVKRGEYLVTTGGCHDCHTPMKMGKQGPEPDHALALSGHPAEMKLPPPPEPKGPWIMSFSATMTAAAGPWGVSYSQNITSDKETGIGKWTREQFVQALRTGKHMGQGRPILPPMPWQVIGKMTDEDLHAIYGYLQTVKPISNRVPDPILKEPPATGGSGAEGHPSHHGGKEE